MSENSDAEFSPTSRTTRRLRNIAIFLVGIGVIALVAFVVPRHLRQMRSYDEMAVADALARSGPVEGAVEAYERVQKRYPGTDLSERAGKERARLQEYVRAAVELQARAADAYKGGRYEEALRLYRKLAAEYPLSLRGRTGEAEVPGCIRLACQELDAAAQKALAAERWAEARDLLGRILALDGSYPNAASAMQSVVEKLQRYERHMVEGAKAEQTQDWRAARKAYEQALAIVHDSAAAFDGRVRALRRLPIPPGMALVLPGEATVGADDGKPDEAPARKFTTPGFYLDITEVTNAQYARFVAARNMKAPPHWGADAPPASIAALPVVCITWREAAEYAAWAGKRLPTELEWERAARGRSGRKYPWGDAFNAAAGVFARHPAPADAVSADRTEEGVLNLAGNVAEWTDEAGLPMTPPPPKSDAATAAAAPKPAVVLKPVRGVSWAGVERDRPDRIVPAGLAGPRSDPARTVLIDYPGIRGVEMRAATEVEFQFRGVVEDQAQVDIIKWLPDAYRFVIAHVLLRPGSRIEAEKNVPTGTDAEAPLLRVKLDTGCTFLSVVNADNPLTARLRYTDVEGKEQEMERTRGVATEYTRAVDPTSDAIRALDKVVREVAWRSLAQAARCSTRVLAPIDGRYINCGFRCAKDLD